MILCKPKAGWRHWLGVFAAAWLPATSVQPATWPDRGPYQKVGGFDEGLSNVKLPVPVVAAVQSLLHDEPSRWDVYDGLHDFAGHGWPILQVASETGYLTLLQARGGWTILSVPASLPVLNEVLDPLGPAAMPNGDQLERYLWHVVLLQKYMRGDFLDAHFRFQNVDNPRYKLWLRGTETSRQALRALCHEPAVSRAGEQVTVRLNVITSSGEVERWTFHLRVSSRVQLEGTDVKLLRRAGTFFYPLA